MPEALGDCGGCYACCTQCGTPPFRNDAERAVLPAGLQQQLSDRHLDIIANHGRHEPGGVCLWLQNGACLHYEHRPPICREFEVGGDQCLWFIALGVGVPDGDWPQDPRGDG